MYRHYGETEMYGGGIRGKWEKSKKKRGWLDQLRRPRSGELSKSGREI